MRSKIQAEHKPNSLPDYAYTRLREKIIQGIIAPGTQLKQLDLAAELNVSQQTIREALKMLFAYGLVEQTHNHGFTVIDMPFHQQENVYRLRGVLECFALDEAVPMITAEHLVQMRDLLPFLSIDGITPVERVRQNNREFHMVPARATGNLQLIRILDQLWDITWTYFYKMDPEDQRENSRREQLEHEALLFALQAKDSLAAKHALQAHIDSTLRQVRRLAAPTGDEKGGDSPQKA